MFGSWLVPEASLQHESEKEGLLQECHFNSYSTELLNLNPFISLLCQHRLALFHRMITFTDLECEILLSWFWNLDLRTEARLSFDSAYYAPRVASDHVAFKQTKALVTYGASLWWRSLPCWVAHTRLHCKP